MSFVFLLISNFMIWVQFFSSVLSSFVVLVRRFLFSHLQFLSLRRRQAPAEAICFRVIRPCRCPSVRDSRGSFMFPRYLQHLLTDFRQTFVTGASRDIDELIIFWVQKVKCQGHSMTKCAREFYVFQSFQSLIFPFGSVPQTKAQTPLLRFVAVLLYSLSYTTNPQQIEVLEFGLKHGYSKF